MATDSTSPLPRRARRSLGLTGLALMALLAASSCGAGSNPNQPLGVVAPHTYRSAYFGFHFSYPSGFSARATQRNEGMVSFKRFIVANAAATRKKDIEPYTGSLSKLPARSAVFLIQHLDGGPPPWLDQPEARFPLRATGFKPVRGVTLPPGASWREYGFSANGWNLVADVYFGSRASRADRAAIWRVVSSLRFRSLRTGRRTAYEFLVLRPASSYPVGSVLRLNGNAFLVHAQHGFYGIGGLAYSLPSSSPCPIRFEHAKFEFACTNGPRRWDRLGRPLWKGAGFRDELGVLVAVKVGQDGHVLFSPDESASGSRALERKYWG